MAFDDELAQKSIEAGEHRRIDVAVLLQSASTCLEHLQHRSDVIMVLEEDFGAIHSVALHLKEMLKDGDFLRASVKRGGERYLVYLPVSR